MATRRLIESRRHSESDDPHNLIVEAASLHRPASSNAIRSRPPGRPLRSRSGLRSQPDLRILGLQQRPISSGSLSASALPPVLLRGVSATSANSVAPAAAEMAAVVLQGRPGSQARPPSGGSHMSEFTDDDDVSRWTASSCSSFRGPRPDSSGSHVSNRSTTLGQLRGAAGSHHGQRKRWRGRSPEGSNTGAVCCPRGHELLNVERDQGWFCRGCGRVSSQTKMECYRCKRCNYNLCDQCYCLQASENDATDPAAPTPPFSRPETQASVASVARQIDDLLAQQAEDGMLPNLPPAFSRGLSPPSRTAFPASIRPISGQSSRSERRAQWISSKSPGQTRAATPSTRVSTRRSSSVSAASEGLRFTDPFLRVILLNEWPVDGRFVEDEDVPPHEEAKIDEDVADIEFIDAALAIQGHALRAGSPEEGRRRLDKAYLEQLRKMAKQGSLPLEDVTADLKIWHLTLLRRPARKRLLNLWGRVDPRFKAKFAELDAEDAHGHARNIVSEPATGERHQSTSTSVIDHFPPKPRVGHRDTQGGGTSAASERSSSTSRVQDVSSHQRPGPASSLADSKPAVRPTVAPSGDGVVTIEIGGKLSDKYSERRPSSDSQSSKEATSEEAENSSEAESVDFSEEPDGPSSQVGKPSTATRPTVGFTGEQKDEQTPRGRQAGGSRAFFMPVAKATAAKQVQISNIPKDEEELKEEEASSEEGEPEEITGKLFRVKAGANAIVDEFAKMLLPPAPNAGRLNDSLQTSPSPSGSGHGSIRDDAEGQGEASEENALQGQHTDAQSKPGGRGQRAVEKGPQTVVWSPGLRSSLAEDFKTDIADAWKKVESQDDVAKTMNDLHRRSSELFSTPEADGGVTADDANLDNFFRGSSLPSMPELQREPSLLETHLRLRARRHGERLQHRAEKSLKIENRWDRRQKACHQSLNSLEALGMFADLQRTQLATA